MGTNLQGFYKLSANTKTAITFFFFFFNHSGTARVNRAGCKPVRVGRSALRNRPTWNTLLGPVLWAVAGCCRGSSGAVRRARSRTSVVRCSRDVYWGLCCELWPGVVGFLPAQSGGPGHVPVPAKQVVCHRPRQQESLPVLPTAEMSRARHVTRWWVRASTTHAPTARAPTPCLHFPFPRSHRLATLSRVVARVLARMNSLAYQNFIIS